MTQNSSAEYKIYPYSSAEYKIYPYSSVEYKIYPYSSTEYKIYPYSSAEYKIYLFIYLQNLKVHVDFQESGILSRDFFSAENNLSQKPLCLRPSLFLRRTLSCHFYCKYYCL